SWLSVFGLDASQVNLEFLQFLLFISVIAGFTQILEIIIEKFSPALYMSLGLYLPLIAVNCAILGACLFAVTRNYPFIPNLIYVLGSALGWWLAIALIAAIREKLAVSNVVPGLKGMGITFIMSGLMSMAFMGFTGIKLADPTANAAEESLPVEPVEKTDV
ncbi:MAG: Rnf-Nqr domain containing protein, partial [Parachlamydiaceae bacterium]|nr:Rnf-Nqr domain containing protein [Parachlamydiaceae bacterium]